MIPFALLQTRHPRCKPTNIHPAITCGYPTGPTRPRIEELAKSICVEAARKAMIYSFNRVPLKAGTNHSR
ncbi:hypothetical protein GCM10009786_00600 [Leucobacter alluvii]|uniref:Uncharacterized protein n=1 Tax=Leucobacter alluvii TaxID=340321 RepID=A0ABP5MWM8_9MICO